MARQKGEIQIDTNDIVGKCFGKLEVVSYHSMKYDSTKGGARLRHWYTCFETKKGYRVIQRGQIVQEGRRYNGNKDAK